MPVKLICNTCDREYFRSPYAAKKSRFCSNKCRAVWSGKTFVEDLTNQRFGRLVVFNRSPIDGKHDETRWVCQCDCGKTITTYKSSLKSGKTKSCGCLKLELSRDQASKRFSKPIKPGTTFNRLTVIKRHGTHKGGSHTYLCKCSCGNKTIVTSAVLRSGTTKSCGCYNIDQIKKRSTTHGLSNKSWFGRYRKILRREADSKWTSRMNEELLNFQKRCVVCNSRKKLCIDHVRPFSKGYGLEPGNAVILCRSCNSKKNARDLDDLPVKWRRKIQKAAKEFFDHWQKISC